MTPAQKNRAIRKAEKLRRLVHQLEYEQDAIKALGVQFDQQDFNRAKEALWKTADAITSAAQ